MADSEVTEQKSITLAAAAAVHRPRREFAVLQFTVPIVLISVETHKGAPAAPR